MKYTNQKIGQELKAQLEIGYNIKRISKWAFGIFHDYLGDLSNDQQDTLIGLFSMEDDPQFELNEQELQLLAEKLINNEEHAFKTVNEGNNEKRGQA
jgi:hypothetical protein